MAAVGMKALIIYLLNDSKTQRSGGGQKQRSNQNNLNINSMLDLSTCG